MGPDTGVNFGRVSYGKVSNVAFVNLLNLLHQLIGLDGYVEKKGIDTHRNKGCASAGLCSASPHPDT